MKPLSSHSRIGHDTTPATHGDLEIWSGRIIEQLEEKVTEAKEEVKTELRAEIVAAKEEVKAELRAEIRPLRDQVKNNTEQLIEVKDQLYDMSLLLKSIAKKVLGK